MDIRQEAIEYLKSMTIDDRNRIKGMVLHGITAGYDYAMNHGISPDMFNAELKLIFEGK